jgi:hypothetical protein
MYAERKTKQNREERSYNVIKLCFDGIRRFFKLPLSNTE